MSVVITGENFSPIRRTIKNNNIFLVTDANGNIVSNNASGYGLYTDDTRFLSRLEFKINNSDAIILSSSTETGHSSIIIGTNGTIKDNISDKIIEQESVQIKRESIIYGAYFETITIANYNLVPIGVKIDLFFESDFLDIFEVRNISSLIKGTRTPPLYEDGVLKFIYFDTTGATLTTEITFIEESPDTMKYGTATFEFELEPSAKKEIKYQINLRSTASLPEKVCAYDFNEAFEFAIKRDKEIVKSTARYSSNNEDFNELLIRGYKDINMLTTRAHYGEYVAAGIPWFTTLFGRDSLIAARQALMLNPNIAKNVLITLARFQGKEDNPWRDEEPGKIPHEIRFGELARSNIVPHSPYYGSVDATALWIMLLYDYFKWTNDIETLKTLWPNAIACLNWIKSNLRITGYTSYLKRSAEGLDNQCWKDSRSSIVHEDGTWALPPLSLIEPQGYTYAAKTRMAELAQYMDNILLKNSLLESAERFKKKFHKDFWMEDKQFYALGLDKDGKQMKVITSNPGQCIETGLFDIEYSNLIADRFFTPDMFSGWGIRTLSRGCLAYNPMSYHNGSIWPHDNSIIALGLSKIGRIDLTLKVTSALFEAARLMQYKRLPELFCGFSRVVERQDPPVMYPVACNPQAWAAASIFLLIQSMLNITPNAQNNELFINNPTIPDWLDYLRIDNIRLGDAYIDTEFRKTSKGLVIDVLEKRGKIDILIKK